MTNGTCFALPPVFPPPPPKPETADTHDVSRDCESSPSLPFSLHFTKESFKISKVFSQTHKNLRNDRENTKTRKEIPRLRLTKEMQEIKERDVAIVSLRYPVSRAALLGRIAPPAQGAIPPLALSYAQPHLCETPFCNTGRKWLRQFMGTWDFLALSAGKPPCPYHSSVLGRGLWFLGGGSANFILMGAGIFLDY